MSHHDDFDHDMNYDDMRHLLREAQIHANDYGWLDQRADRLYTAMKMALYSHADESLGADTLLNIYPWVIARQLTDRWGKHLYDVFRVYLISHESERQKLIPVTIYLGQSQAANGNLNEAIARFESALKKSASEELLEHFLDVYVTYFNQQLFKMGSVLPPELEAHALQLANRLQEPLAYAQIYQSIGRAHLSQHKFDSAIHYCRLSLRLWRDLRKPGQAATSLYLLGLAHRLQQKWRVSLRYQRMARYFYSQTNRREQFSLIDYEQAITRYGAGQYQEAIQLIDYVMCDLQVNPVFKDQNHYTARLWQTKGMALVELNAHREAYQSFEQALSLWEKLDNAFEQVMIYNSLCYSERQQGNESQARTWMSQARSLLATLTDTPATDYLHNLLNETEAEL